jgi:hypothetical protein
MALFRLRRHGEGSLHPDAPDRAAIDALLLEIREQYGSP